MNQKDRINFVIPYYTGAIVGSTICVFLPPDYLTPFIWALIFINIESIRYLLYRLKKK